MNEKIGLRLGLRISFSESQDRPNKSVCFYQHEEVCDFFKALPRITRARMGLIIPMSVALAIDFVDPGFWVRYRRVTTVVLI